MERKQAIIIGALILAVTVIFLSAMFLMKEDFDQISDLSEDPINTFYFGEDGSPSKKDLFLENNLLHPEEGPLFTEYTPSVEDPMF